MRRLLTLFVFLLLVLSAHPTTFAQGPQLTVMEPNEGATITDDTVTVRFDVENFEIVPSTVPLEEAGEHPEANQPGQGHLHFMLDLQPVVVHESEEPYTFSDIAPGEHVLMVELANNDHSALSPPVVQQIRFRVATPETLPETGRNGTLPTWLSLVGLAMTLTGLAAWHRRRRYRDYQKI
ncbi:MAG: DUF6130 family protein [Chloroflexota bacterium]|nr:DUF6130 family protein [Chloroflexota bacterium]